MDQRERELEDRWRGLEDREPVGKEGAEETQRKIEEVERRERELEERVREFEKEKEKWVEERNTPNERASPEVIMTEPREWINAMETLKKELTLVISSEREKAEERELALEMRVMKKVTELQGTLDKDEQNSTKGLGGRKRWDVSIKPLARRVVSFLSLRLG